MSTLLPGHTERELAEEALLLEEAWRAPGGLWGWLAAVDHRSIALRYMITAFGFFILAGVAALVMRLQLAQPQNEVLGPDAYNQFFSVHGTTMMFLFAVPIMLAFGLYFVPLMLGARDVAYPRLNALGYWTYLLGGLLLWGGFALNTGPDAGWFNYVPLAGPEHAPGKRIDVWAQTITFTEIAALIAAIQIIATTLKMRAPGMTLNRIPLFVWAMLVTSVMVIFAMPTVATASIMLSLDRLVGTHFFNPAEGGDALLWQHLFWFFGHPEVYIIFLPATGFISALLPAFTRRPVYGYTVIVVALVATGFLSFGLWVHHMFATSVPPLGSSFFTAASVMIAIPSGVQVFCWIATIWSGQPRFATPLLFTLGFLFLFVLGGLTGVMIASVPLDGQVHDTFFIVAHFHYVLVGGAVFPLFAALYYWFPKVTGRLLSERLGRWNFGLMFAGMNITFFPMHLLGMDGMTRRVYTYLPEMGWGGLNLAATAGAFLIAVGVAVFVANVVVALRRPRPAGNDPWGADTLEWTLPSPPPSYGFVRQPAVASRAPAWEEPPPAMVVGLDPRKREFLLTTTIGASPDAVHEMPGPTLAPLLAALAVGVFFGGAVFTPWAPVVGGALLLLALLAWGFPHRRVRGFDRPPEADGNQDPEVSG